MGIALVLAVRLLRHRDRGTADRPLAFSAPVPLAPGVLDESSGLAVTWREPALLWSLNDSGNPAELVAVDTLGRVRGRVRVDGATNVDWEELAAGPCGAARCLFIADVGDTLARRPTVTLYRLPEPASTDAVGTATRLTVTLEGGARDIEAMSADPAGDLWLISKGRGLQSPWALPDSGRRVAGGARHGRAGDRGGRDLAAGRPAGPLLRAGLPATRESAVPALSGSLTLGVDSGSSG
jgi:hypothetical protein